DYSRRPGRPGRSPLAPVLGGEGSGERGRSLRRLHPLTPDQRGEGRKRPHPRPLSSTGARGERPGRPRRVTLTAKSTGMKLPPGIGQRAATEPAGEEGVMAERDYTPYQQKIIKRYYDNNDTIQRQRLAELVGELYLATGKKRERAWTSIMAA